MTLSVIPAAAAAQLAPLIQMERMVPYEPWDHEHGLSSLAAGARIEIMDVGGNVRRWEYADLADWHDAIAFRVVAGASLECPDCENWMTVEEWASYGSCEDCVCWKNHLVLSS